MVECCFKQPVFLFLSVWLPPAQLKAEGEPEVKKGKTELEEDEDEEDKEGIDESPEEVQKSRFCNCYMEHIYDPLTELFAKVFTPRFNPTLFYSLYYSQEFSQGLYRA